MTTSKREPNEPDPGNEAPPLVSGFQQVRLAHDERRRREQAEQEFKTLLGAVCYPMRDGCRTRWIRWDASAFGELTGATGEESEMQAAEKLLDLWSAVAVALRELEWAKAWASVDVEVALRSARVLGNFEKAGTLCARDVVEAGAYVLGELLDEESDPTARARVLGGYLTNLRRMELRGEAPRVFECLGLYLDAVRGALERRERASNGAPVQQRRGRVLPLPKDAPNSGRRRTPRRSSDPRPLTSRQVEVYGLVQEHKGNLTAVARALGLDRSTVAQHHSAALEKLGKQLGKKPASPKTNRLPLDKRAQVNIGEDERG